MRFSFRTGHIELRHEREKDALRIVAEGAIAHPGVAEGRLIPLVIVDSSSRPDLEEYIRIHSTLALAMSSADGDSSLVMIIRLHSASHSRGPQSW